MADFQSTDIVFADVKSMLSSFDSNNLLSETDMFRWCRFVMNQLGTYSYKERNILIPIENHKQQKPEDFKLLKEAYVCSVESEGSSSYKGYITTPQVYTIHDFYSTHCFDKCDVCYDNNEYYVKRVITKEFTVPERKITTRVPMQIDRRLTHEQCASDCINKNVKCDYTFNISNDTITTSFKEGWINLVYYAMPTDEEGYPLILNDPLCEQAVEDYLIYKSFQKIYYNADADVLQRMQYAEQKSIVSLKELILYSKTDSWASLVEFARKRKYANSMFNITSHSDATRIQQHSQRR